jgi:hypothetical protein
MARRMLFRALSVLATRVGFLFLVRVFRLRVFRQARVLIACGELRAVDVRLGLAVVSCLLFVVLVREANSS